MSKYSEASLSQLHHLIESYLNENPRSSVHFKSVVAKDDPLARFNELNSKFNNSSVEIVEQSDHYFVEVNRKIKRSGRRVDGSFALFQHDDSKIWTALTAEGADFVKRGLDWVIRSGSPHIYEFYATSRDLEGVLDFLARSVPDKFDIIVTQAIAYSHRDQAEISYKKRPYPVVFRKAREGGNYIDSLNFDVRSDEGTELVASINRNGGTKIHDGNVSIFFNHLLENYVHLGTEKDDLFTGKERNAQSGEVEEIELRFDSPVFQSPKDNELLISVLSDLSRSSVTVYHANPYAHLSVLDFNDGSSCDVFVTDPETVAIVPSYRGSNNFLMRISDKLYRELDESSIHYLEEKSFGIEDFLEG